jgi:hypothetical protein
MKIFLLATRTCLVWLSILQLMYQITYDDLLDVVICFLQDIKSYTEAPIAVTDHAN